jgi:hypothetical protein
MRIVVYANSDDALLIWAADALADGCQGFAVQRKLKAAGGTKTITSWLDNFAPPGRQQFQSGEHHPSTEWPFRAFTWTDHSVARGDTVRYRVLPVLADAAAASGLAPPDETEASPWSPARVIGSPSKTPYEAYFNRGFVISQFISRYLTAHFPGLSIDAALTKFKAEITDDVEDEIRAFLSGEVRTVLLGLMRDANANGDEIHAALFELSDSELIDGLKAFGPRAHVVLSNGSISQGKTETLAHARARDENTAARTTLLAAGVKVDVEKTHRFIAPGPLGHNKFVVFSTGGVPKRVWTGSTNWTPTGLCTQINNALVSTDPATVQAYRDQWQALRDAHSTHPKSLVTANGVPATTGPNGKDTVRFSRAPKDTDLAQLKEIVDGAEHGVLFLMFQPGGSGVFKYVRDLAVAKPALLVRGVVSELPLGAADEQSGPTTTVRVSVVDTPSGPGTDVQTYDVVQAANMQHPAAGWVAETTREQFKSDIGFAIIHSKILVVDPFGAKPIVVTGSHNFSLSASRNNDENLVIVRDDPALAEAYAVNVQAAWRHYAPRVGNPHHALYGIEYLRALRTDQTHEQAFWGPPHP